MPPACLLPSQEDSAPDMSISTLHLFGLSPHRIAEKNF